MRDPPRGLRRVTTAADTTDVHPDPTATRPVGATDRRGGPARSGGTLRDLVVDAVRLPARQPVGLVLAGAVVVAETVGLLTRRACAGGDCGSSDWATLLDMDALGSLPRALITLLLAATALVCAHGLVRAGRHGAALWWAVLGLGGALLAAAKHWSVHSLVEERLAGLMPGADVQLLFVLVSAVGLVVVLVSGRWVRRDTRTAVATWLALYALASVGLAAITVGVSGFGPLVADLSTWVEETGEGLAAVGLLVAVRQGVVAIARRQAVTRPGGGAQPVDA